MSETDYELSLSRPTGEPLPRLLADDILDREVLDAPGFAGLREYADHDAPASSAGTSVGSPTTTWYLSQKSTPPSSSRCGARTRGTTYRS